MDSFDGKSDQNPPSHSKIGLGALMKQLREFRQSNTTVMSGRQLHPTLSPGMHIRSTFWQSLIYNQYNTVDPLSVLQISESTSESVLLRHG
jgi:hypothetical protein